VRVAQDRAFGGERPSIELLRLVQLSAELKRLRQILHRRRGVCMPLAELDELDRLARGKNVLAKIVYHKLLDPDHKKLRTLVADGELKHVNTGYCTLLEPKSISGGQFAEWIKGRNPGTYVAVHYIKLIDFTFGGRLKSISCTGQRGIVGPADGPTWDSTQLRMIYEYSDGREAAFDIHTSWVTPDNFPGYVDQEVQFRFDNGVWNGHSRKRGIECTVEDRTPFKRKININNHYNGQFLEPWGERSQRGYGVEVLERFVREVAAVEFGGPDSERPARLAAAQKLNYNDLSADRQVVAAVQAMEAILAKARAEYDVVLVDAPPLLPVTDGALLAAQADGAILVVRQGKTTKDQLEQAHQRLGSVDARVLGAVLNMTPERGADSYSYGYGYAPLVSSGGRRSKRHMRRD